jgi:hypothetical protein
LALTLTGLVACDDDDTYADRVKRESKQISSFLTTGATAYLSDTLGGAMLEVPGDIRVISESEFYANDSTTDVSRNEYVLFSGSGVYMQIVRKGTGKTLEEGETATILNRYIEYNIAGDSIQTSNMAIYYAPYPETMSCTNSYGLYSGSFVSGVMKTTYGASVPSAWLIPLPFIRLGRQDSEDDGVAKVRLITPHGQGQSDASYSVYPCFYEITYMRGR